MVDAIEEFADVGSLLREEYPKEPVYCIFPHVYRETAKEVLGEPGRALAAPGMSTVVEILLRKDNRLFINDGMYGMYGMYGLFWVPRIDGHNRYPVRAFRDGQPLEGATMEFQLNGPTCDSTDTLPGLVPLPVDIRSGDYLEFGNIGAYSLTGRTDYNGYYSDRIVTITSTKERPPAE